MADQTPEIGGVDPCSSLRLDTAGGGHDKDGYGGGEFNAGESGSADTCFPDGARTVDDRRGREWHAVAVMGGHGEEDAEEGRGGQGQGQGRGGGNSGEIALALNKLRQRMADLAELAAMEGFDDEVSYPRRGEA